MAVLGGNAVSLCRPQSARGSKAGKAARFKAKCRSGCGRICNYYL